MCFLLSFLFVFLFLPLVQVQADWYAVDREVVCGLLFEEKDRAEWFAELQAKAEKTREDQTRIFILAARSGDETAALDALERLGVMNDSYEPLAWTVYTLKNPVLARLMVERFPQMMTGNFSLRDFFPNPQETDPETARLWVEARFHEYSPAATPVPHDWKAGNPWSRPRVEAFRNAGKLEELLDELQSKVQTAPNEPTRTDALLDFLWNFREARGFSETRKDRDFAWIRTCVPERAGDLFAVAEFLREPKIQEFQTAYDFLILALEKPLTEDEIRKTRTFYSSRMVSDEEIRTGVRLSLLRNLADVCRELNRPEEAQKWMLEEKKLVEKSGEFDFRHAGQIQAFSGQRVVEGEIREKEKTSENSVQYWIERAKYYAGRGKECEKEQEEALLRALTFPDYDFSRRQAMDRLAELWYAQGRKVEVKKLLRDEIRTAPKDSPSRQMAVNFFKRSDRQGILEPDFPELWDWLAETDDWKFPGEGLLWRIFEVARENEPEKLDEYYTRAEKLADRPQRAAYLGWVLNRMNEPERSLPLLRLGAQSEDAQVRNSANFTLLESFIDLRRWDEALAHFPTACEQLTTGEIPAWLSRIGEGAREVGNERVATECERRLSKIK